MRTDEISRGMGVNGSTHRKEQSSPEKVTGPPSACCLRAAKWQTDGGIPEYGQGCLRYHPTPLSQSTACHMTKSLGKPGSPGPRPCQCLSWLSLTSPPASFSHLKVAPQIPIAFPSLEKLGGWVSPLSPRAGGTLRAGGKKHKRWQL